MVKKAPQISYGSRICDSCRKKFGKEQPPIPEVAGVPAPVTLEQQNPEFTSTSPESEESDSESHHI
jgi:hypothetical protein